MDWFFDGLGTMLLGLVVGGGGGTLIGYRIGIRNSQVQKQRAGRSSTQNMIGGNQIKGDVPPPSDPPSSPAA